MKKLLGTVLILLSTLFVGFAQQDNNSTDDVYYNDESNIQQQANPPAQDQNYDDDNNDNSSAPTYQTFYDQLSPYGSWVNYPGYGYCWVPNGLDPSFSPYMTNGHWVYTDMGWTWVSDFAWGWGPFHYGRWFEDPYYGWMWLPGYDWAPAWVIWGDYGGYYGWACLGPHDVLSPHFRPSRDHWHFVEHQYMGRQDFGSHIMRTDDVIHGGDINGRINIISHANTYHQSVFFSGPKADEVARYSGQEVHAVHINNVSDPKQTRVEGGNINIYRPAIVRNNDQHVTPNKVNNLQDLQQKPNSRPAQNQNQSQQQGREQRNTPATPDRQQQNAQQWTPPRQSVPVQQRQYSAPAQQPVQRSYVPSQQPAQHYSAPAQQHYSAPAGGGARGGGGRR